MYLLPIDQLLDHSDSGDDESDSKLKWVKIEDMKTDEVRFC